MTFKPKGAAEEKWDHYSPIFRALRLNNATVLSMLIEDFLPDLAKKVAKENPELMASIMDRFQGIVNNSAGDSGHEPCQSMPSKSTESP